MMCVAVIGIYDTAVGITAVMYGVARRGGFFRKQPRSRERRRTQNVVHTTHERESHDGGAQTSQSGQSAFDVLRAGVYFYLLNRHESTEFALSAFADAARFRATPGGSGGA